MSSKEDVARRLGELEKLVDGELIPLREKVKELEKEVKASQTGYALEQSLRIEQEGELQRMADEKHKLSETCEEFRKENEMLQKLIKGSAGLMEAIDSRVDMKLESFKTPVQTGDIDRIKEYIDSKFKDLQPPSQGLTVESTRAEIEVKVSRPPVVAEETSLRGQIAILIHEGELDKYNSARNVGRKLKQLGYSIAETSSSIFDELNWFTKQRILMHSEKEGWMAVDKSRIKVKTVD